MLKYVAGLVLVFGLAVYISIQDERATQQAAQNAAQSNKGTIPAKPDEQHPQQNIYNPERNLPRWYRFFRWGDGTTTWVIVLTLLAIAEQARESAKATQAMRDSLPHQEMAARAAKETADAQINAERAWIIPELKCLAVQGESGRWYKKAGGAAFTSGDILSGKHLRYIVKLTNMGRTPAHISEVRISSTLLAEGVRDLSPNAAGDTWQSHKINQFIAGGESAEITEPVLAVDAFISAEWLAIRELKKTAVFHGWVTYRHMFSREEDRAEFCYVYTPKLNHLSSVPRHTKYTQQDSEQPN